MSDPSAKLGSRSPNRMPARPADQWPPAPGAGPRTTVAARAAGGVFRLRPMSGCPSTSTIEMPGRSPFASASRAVSATDPIGASIEARCRPRRRGDEAAVDPVDAGVVAGRQRDDDLGRDPAERAEVGDEPEHAERHDPGARSANRCRGRRGRARPLVQPPRARRAPSGRCRSGRSRSPCPVATRRSMSASDIDVVPPLMWPTMSGPASMTVVGADRGRAGQRRARRCGSSRPCRARAPRRPSARPRRRS